MPGSSGGGSAGSKSPGEGLRGSSDSGDGGPAGAATDSGDGLRGTPDSAGGEPANPGSASSERPDPDGGEPANPASAAHELPPETANPAGTEPTRTGQEADAGGVEETLPTEQDTPPLDPVPAIVRFRALVLLAVGPLVGGYVLVATLLALVTGTAGNARFTTSGVLTAALPGWLAAHQVPVEILGRELGVLPILPTIGVVLVTAKIAALTAERLDLRRPRQVSVVIGTVAVAHAVAGLVVARLTADTVVSAGTLDALYYPALVAALAATLGVARRGRLREAVAGRVDAVAFDGLRAGAFAVVLLLAAGGAVLTFGLVTSVPAARDLFPAGAGNAVGMLLLCLGYLPNAVVAATGFIAGPGFSLGAVAVSPIEFHGGATPGVPLLAALPEYQALWWPALFVLPLAVGIAVGRRLRDVDEDPVARLRGVAVAGGIVAVCFVVFAGTAGGRLGAGPFDPVSMRAAALSVALVLWIAVPGAIVAWFGGPHPADVGLIEFEPEDEAVRG
ncbi:DUF6350 family protein [Actinophytocola oryzae]|uniref:Uncharacterized protein n=1 Tax=Actinophytocola oryzae TaxID=502181 RepID=A0A4R7UX49_9PSEU|nr:DUF6350 family protein [Actinophytocola oryzae]TDV41379.1 hypothetical protein CLV71_12069 [Actinophytocola oryzae]